MESPPDTPVLGSGREREEQEARNANELMTYVSEYCKEIRTPRYQNP